MNEHMSSVTVKIKPSKPYYDKDRGTIFLKMKRADLEINQITVQWLDGYLEKFKATKIHFDSDLLFLCLEDGKDRYIPFRSVRWFSSSIESHEDTFRI